MYCSSNNIPSQEQVKGLKLGIINYIKSKCFTSFVQNLNQEYLFKINHFKRLINNVQNNKTINNTDKQLLIQSYTLEIRKINEEMSNFKRRVKSVQTLQNLYQSDIILNNISVNVLKNFIPNDPRYHYINGFNGGSCPMNSNGDGYLCEFGPNPIVAAIVNILLTVEFNLDMYLSQQTSHNYVDINTKLLINLRDIQSSLPIPNQNDFVFNPTPTSCREATVRKQEIDYKRNPRELKEGLFVNDYVGSVDVTRNRLNIPGARLR